MNHDALVEKFAQTVGVEKARRLVDDAADQLGIDVGGVYADPEVADICEAVQQSADGYVGLVANEIRVHRQAQRRFDALLDEISDPVVTVAFESGEPVVTATNPAFESTFGYDDAAGASLTELIVPDDDRADATDRWLRADSDGVEVQRLTADGERRTFLFRSVVATRERGTVEGYGIYTDITERTRRERQLELQNEQLERFASVVSHDLRNPLQVADAQLGLALRSTDDPELVDYIQAVDDAHDRMERLIDDLLTLARQGRVVDETDPVALDGVARRAWTVVSGPEADFRFDGADARIEADKPRLRQLLENLFRNAVEHGSTTGRSAADDAVTVRVGLLDEQSGFYVEDDGPGIPEGEREQVFDHGYSTAQDGTGFGLAIVKAIADAHGWSVRVTDSRVGGESAAGREAGRSGARFEVTGVETAEADPVGR